jgi:hypothetical protein
MHLEITRRKLLSACENNNIIDIKTLFNKYIKFNQVEFIYNCYYKLAELGNIEALKYLLDNTPQKNITNELKYWICIYGITNNHKHIVKLILTFQPDINYLPLSNIISNDKMHKCLSIIQYCNTLSSDQHIEYYNELISDYIVNQYLDTEKNTHSCKNCTELTEKYEKLLEKIDNIEKLLQKQNNY